MQKVIMTKNKPQHEAKLYHTLDKKRVQCDLCAHGCRIAEGKRGLCGVRQNIGGKLYTLNYGKAIAANLDPIEKKPLYHFLPGTEIFSVAAAGCNFRCKFCQNWQISQITKGKDGRIIGENLPPEQIVDLALEYQVQSIAYTYTEPTIFFEYAMDTAQLAHKQGLKNVFVTNGYQTPAAIEQMSGLIDAANIDLKAFTDDYYRRVCGASLQPVLDSIQNMYNKGIWIELTTLVIPGENDSKEELQQIAEFIAGIDKNIPWHISRFFPQYKMTQIEMTPLATMEMAYKLGKEAGLNYVYLGNVAEESYSNTSCPNGHVVIKRHGYLVENLLEQGACPECGAEVAGVFE
jgi:pyruvate formate lyase activating enzyme